MVQRQKTESSGDAAVINHVIYENEGFEESAQNLFKPMAEGDASPGAVERAKCGAESTPRDTADGFRDMGEWIRKELQVVEYRNHSSLQRWYEVIYRPQIEKWIDLVKKYANGCSDFEELPRLEHGDYVSVLVQLAEWCDHAADMILGKPQEEKPEKLLPTHAVVKDYIVSRATLQRQVKSGNLTDYRPKSAPQNATSLFDENEIKSKFTSRQEK